MFLHKASSVIDPPQTFTVMKKNASGYIKKISFILYNGSSSEGGKGIMPNIDRNFAGGGGMGIARVMLFGRLKWAEKDSNSSMNIKY